MDTLSAFFYENCVKNQNVKFVPSARFVDENGNPIKWEICCISSAEDENIRISCKKRVETDEKYGRYKTETDYNLYLARLAARCTVYPNLNDAKLQNSYGVMGAEELLKTMLLPGEYADYIKEVQRINGFDVNFEQKVERSKN